MTQNIPKSKLPIKLILVISILGCFVGVFLRALTYDTTTQHQELSKNIPEFNLPSVTLKNQFITQEDLKNNAPLLVNIWASWCAPCRNEHKQLTRLAKDFNIKIFGLNYKDSINNGQKFLEQYGNPFFKVANDTNGITTLNWGIRGVPETFIINKQGKITYRHTGEIQEKDIETILEKLK